MTLIRGFSCVVAVSAVLFISDAWAFDKVGYTALVKETVQQVLGGKVADVDALIAKQQKLVQLGVAGCKEYGAAHAQHAKLMDLVAANADKMQAMTLDEIEKAWHDGAVPKASGIDPEKIDHFSPAISFMDAVVHPATAVIALNEYKSTKNPALLKQVKDELSEVLEHMEHIK